jgi:hypothetical protein
MVIAVTVILIIRLIINLAIVHDWFDMLLARFLDVAIWPLRLFRDIRRHYRPHLYIEGIYDE